jgi:hypothetical protein
LVSVAFRTDKSSELLEGRKISVDDGPVARFHLLQESQHSMGALHTARVAHGDVNYTAEVTFVLLA